MARTVKCGGATKLSITDPDTIARALARLANGTHQTHTLEPEREPAGVVADAEAAITDLGHAAAFLDAGGERRLRRAVRLAENDGQPELAARARGVLETLTMFRRAASGGDKHE